MCISALNVYQIFCGVAKTFVNECLKSRFYSSKENTRPFCLMLMTSAQPLAVMNALLNCIPLSTIMYINQVWYELNSCAWFDSWVFGYKQNVHEGNGLQTPAKLKFADRFIGVHPDSSAWVLPRRDEARVLLAIRLDLMIFNDSLL